MNARAVLARNKSLKRAGSTADDTNGKKLKVDNIRGGPETVKEQRDKTDGEKGQSKQVRMTAFIMQLKRPLILRNFLKFTKFNGELYLQWQHSLKKGQ